MSDHFEEWLLGHKLSDNTVNQYLGVIRRTRTLVVEQGWDLSTLTARQVRWLADAYPQSRGSLVQLRAALSHYWKMIGYDGPIDALVPPTETGPTFYRGLDDSKADRLEAYARDHDGLVVLVGLYLGLRRSEIAGLRWSDFTPDLEWVRVRGKGRKTRTIPVSHTLELEPTGEWVFPSRHGHISDSTAYARIRRMGVDAGIGPIKPHALRHTCLTRLYRKTNNLRLVQEFAGHSSSSTTERYTWVGEAEMRQAIEGFRYGEAA